MTSSPIRIYGDKLSGNCQKVRIVADFMRVPYEWIDVDVTKGETHTPEFLARNQFGQVPTVALSDGRYLAQSNAIVLHLARGGSLVPTEPFARAKVDEWMFWEQYSHEPYVAVARFHMFYRKESAATRDAKVVERGEKALDLLERWFGAHRFLVDDHVSAADVAVLPYTRLAHEGGFDMVKRPKTREWIGRCEQDLGIVAA
jgi:glutathione S-transferase